MRTFAFIVASVFFAGASHRLFAGEYLEAALGVCIAVQMLVIDFYVWQNKCYRKCLEGICEQLDRLKESLKANNEQD